MTSQLFGVWTSNVIIHHKLPVMSALIFQTKFHFIQWTPPKKKAKKFFFSFSFFNSLVERPNQNQKNKKREKQNKTKQHLLLSFVFVKLNDILFNKLKPTLWAVLEWMVTNIVGQWLYILKFPPPWIIEATSSLLQRECTFLNGKDFFPNYYYYITSDKKPDKPQQCKGIWFKGCLQGTTTRADWKQSGVITLLLAKLTTNLLYKGLAA